ncbi:bifunctional DNA primase/polymerase [Bradyrhizobium sp. CCGUVB23]|uniref:bifunctional DNA primase/polymerase n=1 Tax=Bradyrhizobium sp. CCGUVB23 TaxID=2949630 RepID=UPI0020B4423D|nr:bifunctional DNA primase/polymerase [Bradyrhizobium sp. CCGUVB23]MCP3464477.1 bifunctional DNA primase/polymerase [Bradyrhizobium sp. CCGUVB23]
MNDLLAAALDYAARRLPVFPIVPRGKTPAVARGFYAATTNPATIRRYWTDPDRNIGIPTGASSGAWVLDIDGDEGAVSLRDLEVRYGAIPKTRSVITSRGRHLWFAYPGAIPSSAARIGDGLDVRADGGYVVAPPSVHESGHIYAFEDAQTPLVEAPAWLIIAARTKPIRSISEAALATIRPIGNTSGRAYGQAALRDETAILAATPRGSRNHALNKAAFNLFRLVAGGELTEAEVVESLRQACLANGLAQDDGWNSVGATIRSARMAGIQHPRSRGTP